MIRTKPNRVPCPLIPILEIPPMPFQRTTCQRSFATSAFAVLFASLLIHSQALAQNAVDANWRPYAEDRFKAIYDRSEFRAKTIRPTWQSDSSGFYLEEEDPQSKQTRRWFYDAQTGERRAASPEKPRLPPPTDKDLEKTSPRLVSRDAKLVSIDPITKQEIVLVSAEPSRSVDYRQASWSPDGKRALFVEADYTEVRQRWVLVPGDPSYPGVQQNRFARVGEKIEQLRIGMVNADGENLQWLPIDTPQEGMYLGQVEWAGNSEEVLVEKFSRFRDNREFLLANVNGKVQSIYSESNDAWVESSQGKNSGLVWIRGGEEFIVISERDGWRHAYRYSRNGNQLALLTHGDYDIIDRASVDEKGGWYYFYASPFNATQKYLYRVPLDGSGKMHRLTPENQFGTHGYQFSPDFHWAIHTHSTLNTPPIHELIEVETHRVKQRIEDNHAIVERMKTLRCQPAEFLKLDIGNGIVMDAWMIKPKDVDSSKKYPLFIYVYGEPHAQTVLDEWGAVQIDFHRVVAEMGYIVVSMDNRGTPAPKGAAWRRAIFGSLGPLSTDEQEAGLKAISKQYPFIDATRVGIWGWSGGGSNTLNALFRKPQSYQLGIAVVPKPQPHLYNAWFQEIFMRNREVNRDGYERSAPLNFAEGLQGKLLIMTGSGETNTHIQIIEGLVDRLIALGKPFDYMVYPNRDHGLREGEGTLVHVRMHILRYLMEHLTPGPM